MSKVLFNTNNMVPQVCERRWYGLNHPLVIGIDETGVWVGGKEKIVCFLLILCSIHQLLLLFLHTTIGEGRGRALAIGLQEEEEEKRRRRRRRPRLLPSRTRRQHISGIGVATKLVQGSSLPT